MPMEKIGAMLLIVGLIVGVVSGYGIGYMGYQPQISQFQSDVSEKDTQISKLQSNLTDAQTELEETIANVTLLLSNITSLETQLEETLAELMPGRIPILHVGDYWIMEIVYNATAYTMTQSLIEAYVDHYLMYMTYDPPYMGEINETRWVDKSTLDPTRIWGHINYTYDTTTIPYTFNSTFLYTRTEGVPFLLYVGKKLNTTETIVWNMTTMDGVTSTYARNYSYTYHIVAIENVTVPAGTFTSFKIDMLNVTSGELIHTVWYSDEVKYYVKSIDYTTTPETTYELKGYSI